MLSGDFDVLSGANSQEAYEDAWRMQQEENKRLTQQWHFVFVYGSLMKGFHNHHYLKGCDLIMEKAVTHKRMKMIDLNAYPGIVKAKGLPTEPMARARYRSLYVPISGQVYRVTGDVLKHKLDILEGNGSFYTRELQKIVDLEKQEGCISGEAWMYILPEEFSNQKPCITDENNQYCWRTHRLLKQAQLLGSKDE